MRRIAIVAGVLALGISAVVAQQNIAVQQDNLMRSQGKSMYGVLSKIVKGTAPYDQAAIDAALTQLEHDVGTIATVFKPNPKEQVVNATYGSSQKIWKNKADFDSKIPPVTKAIKEAKGSIKDAASLKVAFDAIDAKCGDCHETYRLKLK